MTSGACASASALRRPWAIARASDSRGLQKGARTDLLGLTPPRPLAKPSTNGRYLRNPAVHGSAFEPHDTAPSRSVR
jgi:hypothetical protein